MEIAEYVQEIMERTDTQESRQPFDKEMQKVENLPSEAELLDRVSSTRIKEYALPDITLTEADARNIRKWEELQENGFRRQTIPNLEAAVLAGGWALDSWCTYSEATGKRLSKVPLWCSGGFNRNYLRKLSSQRAGLSFSKHLTPVDYESKDFLFAFTFDSPSVWYDKDWRDDSNVIHLKTFNPGGLNRLSGETFRDAPKGVILGMPTKEATMPVLDPMGVSERAVYKIGRMLPQEVPRNNEELRRELDREAFNHVFGFYPVEDAELGKNIYRSRDVEPEEVMVERILPEDVDFPISPKTLYIYNSAKKSGLFDKVGFGRAIAPIKITFRKDIDRCLSKDAEHPAPTPFLFGEYRGLTVPLAYCSSNF